MNFLSLTDVSLTLGDTPLFTNVTLGIDSGERIGFIGPNGTGKSTFLSVLTGSRLPDTGNQYRRSNLKVAYLPQIPEVPEGATVADLVFRNNDPKAALVREYESLLDHYSEDQHEELIRLQARMDEESAWNIENTYHSFLTELGIHDLSRKAATLSGGELRKADMARVLASGADLLLLDEPTNHLDLETVEWLEAWLKTGKRSYILVTHDRSFLDSSCDVILELENQTLRKYPGNWSTYLAAKTKRLEEEEKSADKRANILRRELEWASRQPKARGTKDKKRLSRIEDLQDAPQADLQRSAEFSSRGRRLGKKVLELVTIEKSRGGRKVIEPFSYSFKRGERIGIAGPNGAGKTTLLSLISGLLTQDEGRIDIGVNTRFAVLDQSPLIADEALTVLDYMKMEADNVRTASGELVNVSSWLERFGFSGAAQRRKIRYLSGGERRRLQIIRLLMKEPNFLILDEPTNDLDLATLGMLEQFLEEYEGCLLVVSHDRTFLEHIVDYFFILDGGGSILGFSGSWSEYRKLTRERERKKRRETVADTSKTARTPKKGLNFNEKKKMESLMEEILILEEELEVLEQFFSLPSPDPEKLAAAGRRHDPLREEIAGKTSQWEELADRDE
ncbi:MAG: ABC-F family ATP-binding cassette domain-containing protein [Spirochaetaceae bacterium]|nr:ABC-F family ATP-binding cassette domain-containing protein [Spirochaetaceae bacterium]